jgi:hypothetical protein
MILKLKGQSGGNWYRANWVAFAVHIQLDALCSTIQQGKI